MRLLFLAKMVTTRTKCILLLEETEKQNKKERSVEGKKERQKERKNKQTNNSFQGTVYQGIKDCDAQVRGINEVSPVLVLKVSKPWCRKEKPRQNRADSSS